MILLGLVAGWLVGISITWLADYLPRYSTSETKQRFESTHMPALIQCARVVTLRKDGVGLAKSFGLNLTVEFCTALLFAGLWSQSSLTPHLIMLSLLCPFLILVAVIDIKYRLVLNVLVFPAMVLTLLVRFATPGTSVPDALIGGAFGFSIFALTAFVRPGQLGGGDVKLATLIGFIFGFPNVLWALMTGVLAGGAASIGLLSSRRGDAQSQIPYAPFLSFGALIALFYNPLPLLLYRFVGH